MSVLIDVVVVLHILGAAAIIGSWLAAPRDPRVRPAMLWGARAQVVTGLLLVALHEMSGDPAERLNSAKVGVKLVIALVVTACAEIAAGRQRRALVPATVGASGGGAGPASAESPARSSERSSATSSLVGTSGVPAGGLVQVAAWLAILNVCVAVLWR